jgi:hypothetical protein
MDSVVRQAVLEWAHQQRSAEIESTLLMNDFDDSAAMVSVRNLLRYRAASRRALLKNLAQLRGRTVVQ